MKKSFFVFVALVLIIMPRHASAYLDPGTGSFIIQVAIAAIAGFLFTAKTYWNKIKIVFFIFLKKIYRQKGDGNR